MLKVENLTVIKNQKTIIKDINFTIKPNKITAILGINGAGKSTIINCINQTINYKGHIYLHNQNIQDLCPKEKAKEIAILSQNHYYTHITVKELVSLGRSPYLNIFGRLSKKDNDIIDEAINVINIEHLKDSYIDEISGGEKQKAFLAMILAQNSNLIILDEPANHLDIISTNEFLKEIIKLKELHNKTILIVMHDLNQILNIADEIIIIDNGELIYNGEIKEEKTLEMIEKIFKVTKYVIDDKVFLGI